MDQMTEKEWDQLSDLLVKAGDQPFPTWKEKRENMERNLSKSGYAAMQEIAAWGWD